MNFEKKQLTILLKYVKFLSAKYKLFVKFKIVLDNSYNVMILKKNRLRIADLIRGFAVFIMMIRHVISGLTSNFESYKGLKFLFDLGGFAPIIFFTSVGISFYLSTKNKVPKIYLKEKIFSGLCIIGIQEMMIGQAILFDQSFWVLSYIGASIIILAIMFLVKITKSYHYLILSGILILLQYFETFLTSFFLTLLSRIIGGPFLSYIMNAIFYSGWSLFHNLPFTFFGIFLGEKIFSFSKNQSKEILIKSFLITTGVFFISLIIFDIEPGASSWFLSHGPYSVANHLMLISLICYLVIFFSGWEMGNKSNLLKNELNQPMKKELEEGLKTDKKCHLFLQKLSKKAFNLEIFEIFGRFSLQLFVFHELLINPFYNLVPVPIGIYFYLVFFMSILYLLFDFYYQKKESILIISKADGVLFSIRWPLFAISTIFTLVFFISKYLLVVQSIEKSIFDIKLLYSFIAYSTIIANLFLIRNFGSKKNLQKSNKESLKNIN
ncbi:hypothetical protein [Candidatus Lokiarchaeum ossiferum]|uniref:hypothetical protein n=1 Tax=Candidatus Lokiarchaeum ossiferum TaxID=2951803 RepID=UPI00352DA296